MGKIPYNAGNNKKTRIMQAPAQLLKKSPLQLALGIYMLLAIALFIAILAASHGTFIFTLDDPYIHLALAENIRQGHYGVNLQEYSAPSSSILWPLLIAPFTLVTEAHYLVLLLNLALGALTLRVVEQVIRQINVKQALGRREELAILLLFMLGGNLLGLAFTGMEHSLQLLVAVVVAWGLIKKIQTDESSGWLWLAIIAAPLVRYECLAVSAAALLFLFCKREYGKSIAAGLLIVALLGGFSLFLLQLGLSYLPDSVLAKSTVATSGLQQLGGNLLQNFRLPNTAKAVAMALLALFLLANAAVKPSQVVKPSHESPRVSASLRLLSLATAIAMVLHLLAGRIGWYFRYEIYVWGMAMLVFAYLYLVGIKPHAGKIRRRMATGLMVFCLGISSLEGLFALFSTPVAASNIFHQQYQMHRFLESHYRKPVAVNDLGWTTYQNDEYVLDLWGLGSGKARMLRKTGIDSQWMDRLAKHHGIELIMIYHNRLWFPAVPGNWIKVAELGITGPRVTAWFPVTIFARSEASAAEIRQALLQFSNTLPEGSVLAFTP